MTLNGKVEEVWGKAVTAWRDGGKLGKSQTWRMMLQHQAHRQYKPEAENVCYLQAVECRVTPSSRVCDIRSWFKVETSLIRTLQVETEDGNGKLVPIHYSSGRTCLSTVPSRLCAVVDLSAFLQTVLWVSKSHHTTNWLSVSTSHFCLSFIPSAKQFLQISLRNIKTRFSFNFTSLDTWRESHTLYTFAGYLRGNPLCLYSEVVISNLFPRTPVVVTEVFIIFLSYYKEITGHFLG
jgi:hypothetical protein